MQRTGKRKRRRAQKAWTEMSLAERLTEAREAKSRLQDQLELNQRGAYSWEVARNTREAIDRWDRTIGDIQREMALNWPATRP